MARKFDIKQTWIFHDYYSRLKNIALSLFKWEGLPDTCNARFLELCLFNYGRAVFVDDPMMGYLNLKVTPASTLNVYNEPLSYTAFSIGYNKIFNADEVVIARNNYMMKSTDSTIMLFAERLAKLRFAHDVNINAQKTPILIRCDQKTKFSLEKIYEQYEGDKPVIFGEKILEKPFDVLTTGAPFISDKLREEERAVWNEALEFMGINTNPSDKKKERLVIAEVDSNNEQIDIQALTMLMCRQQVCEELKEKWGINATVSLRVDELKELRNVDARSRSDDVTNFDAEEGDDG